MWRAPPRCRSSGTAWGTLVVCRPGRRRRCGRVRWSGAAVGPRRSPGGAGRPGAGSSGCRGASWGDDLVQVVQAPAPALAELGRRVLVGQAAVGEYHAGDAVTLADLQVAA